MKQTTPSDITHSLEEWFQAHPSSEVTFYRLQRTAESPLVCKIVYSMGKGALVLQASGDSCLEAFAEVSERVNRMMGGRAMRSASDITRKTAHES